MLYIYFCVKCFKDEFNDKEICFFLNEEIYLDYMDFQ